MKKFVFTASLLLGISGLASAAVTQCNSGLFSTAYSVSLLNSSFSCEVGDKIFSNFSGTFENSNNTSPSVADTIAFSAQSPTTYTLNYAAGSEAILTTGFTFAFDVTIDPTQTPGIIPAGSVASFSAVSGGIQDSAPLSGSTLNKAITVQGGAVNPCTGGGGVSVTESINSQGISTQNGTPCSIAASPAVTAIHVSETFAYTGNPNHSGVTGFQNTFTQAFTPTSSTPEPVSMLLFGTGLVAFGFIGRKRLVRK